jgi:hypothetical protein
MYPVVLEFVIPALSAINKGLLIPSPTYKVMPAAFPSA